MVVGEAVHTETEEQVVVYFHAGKMWVRPKAMWEEMVMVDGVQMKRFERMEEGDDGAAL